MRGWGASPKEGGGGGSVVPPAVAFSAISMAFYDPPHLVNTDEGGVDQGGRTGGGI